ncbi:DoxX family protein [Bacillus sp. ISL-40]|uniref:DoxX family protein n=1 Tax=unclassified Bacillus (in: firmicutes) TaxID=185979 RepID=UPI001BECC425|nr:MULTISPECIES: DoxX family protein [unclassified Bacillus (in: firmicutes)]MBT2698951.1 DoxX family protein [Bacillus sp. ISL-40]MBT2721085.1 DoxX family protein [Bacillus sp. ISL-46]MBT2742649.1 DoxX family protein [Bacillus sp. ISL-77]
MLVKNEIGALILRVTLGALFLIHGIVKFQGGIENIVGWFESIGLPGFMAYGVALVEIVGGVALIIGLATRLVSALLGLLMIGAILKVKLSVGLLGNGQMAGYELDLAFLAMAVYLAFNGSKLLSVSGMIFQKDSIELKKAA